MRRSAGCACVGNGRRSGLSRGRSPRYGTWAIASGVVASATTKQIKMSRPCQRMNPPHKVGARIWLPGFRINRYESPFHQRLKLPQFNTSVHRSIWQEQDLHSVYDKNLKGEVLTNFVTKLLLWEGPADWLRVPSVGEAGFGAWPVPTGFLGRRGHSPRYRERQSAAALGSAHCQRSAGCARVSTGSDNHSRSIADASRATGTARSAWGGARKWEQLEALLLPGGCGHRERWPGWRRRWRGRPWRRR